MSADLEVKKSKIHGKGVFALRDFKRGEVVIDWHPKILTKAVLSKLTKKQKSYVHRQGKYYYLMQSPERYVNHSFNPNTEVGKNCDIASRLIKRGEEITSHYNKEDLYFLIDK